MKTLNYKVQILILILLICVNSAGIAQVGIGTITPDASAMLDISTTTKGFLPPRMTETERNGKSHRHLDCLSLTQQPTN